MFSQFISRRDFLKGVVLFGGGLAMNKLIGQFHLLGGQKRIYLAPDDHTDYFWSAGEAAYQQAFIDMIDYYLDLTDKTQNNPSEYQSRWNCDGSFLVMDL